MCASPPSDAGLRKGVGIGPIDFTSMGQQIIVVASAFELSQDRRAGGCVARLGRLAVDLLDANVVDLGIFSGASIRTGWLENSTTTLPHSSAQSVLPRPVSKNIAEHPARSAKSTTCAWCGFIAGLRAGTFARPRGTNAIRFAAIRS